MSRKISIIGLGYVGLPLAITASTRGFKVIGIDKNVERLNLLKTGSSGVEGIDKSDLLAAINSCRLELSNDYADIDGSEIVLICVPTPLNNLSMPDLSHLESAAKSIAPYIRQGTLIILESTVEPGTTRNFVLPIIENGSGLDKNEFLIAFSPERIDPLNQEWNIQNTPKLVSGFTDEACQKATKFYANFIEKLVKCDSLEIAETSKLLENSFRLVNISFINEFSIFCHALGIEVDKVISAAATKPYGFMPFYPGPGVGGHCIPIDPIYLTNSANRLGVPLKMVDLADQINHDLTNYFVKRAQEKIGNLFEKKIILIGISYKPNISDIRESPALNLIAELEKQGAIVSWHDNLVKVWNGEQSEELSSNFDLAILATHHDYLELTKLGNVPLLDTSKSI